MAILDLRHFPKVDFGKLSFPWNVQVSNSWKPLRNSFLTSLWVYIDDHTTFIYKCVLFTDYGSHFAILRWPWPWQMLAMDVTFHADVNWCIIVVVAAISLTTVFYPKYKVMCRVCLYYMIVHIHGIYVGVFDKCNQHIDQVGSLYVCMSALSVYCSIVSSCPVVPSHSEGRSLAGKPIFK